MTENKNKRFVYMDLLEVEAISDNDEECYYFNEYGTVEKICGVLNALHEENQRLKRHIKANTLKKIKVEDVFNCAKYDKFYNNKEAIKSIDWIAEQIGIDFE